MSTFPNPLLSILFLSSFISNSLHPNSTSFPVIADIKRLFFCPNNCSVFRSSLEGIGIDSSFARHFFYSSCLDFPTDTVMRKRLYEILFILYIQYHLPASKKIYPVFVQHPQILLWRNRYTCVILLSASHSIPVIKFCIFKKDNSSAGK